MQIIESSHSTLISRFIPEREIQISAPNPPLISPEISSYQSTSDAFSSEVQGVAQSVQQKVEQAIANPEPAVLEKLSQVNQKLQSQGKPPIDLQKTTKDIEAITNSSLSNKEKKAQIEQIRKQLGLSKKEMKTLFTKRLAKIYGDAAKELAQVQKQKQAELQSELREAEAKFGKNSPQAQEVQKKMEVLQSTLEPQRQQYAEKSGFYKSLYPSFWSKLGGFFKKIGKGFMKVLSFVKPFLSLIPGVGTIASMAVTGLQTIVNAVKSKGRSLLSAGFDFLKSKIPGISNNIPT